MCLLYSTPSVFSQLTLLLPHCTVSRLLSPLPQASPGLSIFCLQITHRNIRGPLSPHRWQVSAAHRAAPTHLARQWLHVNQVFPMGLWERAQSSICPFHSNRQKCRILSTYGNFTEDIILLWVHRIHQSRLSEPLSSCCVDTSLVTFCQSLYPGDLLTKSTDSFLIRFKIMRYVRLRTQGLIIYLTFFFSKERKLHVKIDVSHQFAGNPPLDT